MKNIVYYIILRTDGAAKIIYNVQISRKGREKVN